MCTSVPLTLHPFLSHRIRCNVCIVIGNVHVRSCRKAGQQGIRLITKSLLTA
jgi:hypothetical protein